MVIFNGDFNIKNNNPLNICASHFVKMGVDVLCNNISLKFTNLDYGILVGLKILHHYYYKYRKHNISSLVEQWCFSSNKNSWEYIIFVSYFANIDRYQILDFGDCNKICKILQALCVCECGTIIPIDTIISIYKRYFKNVQSEFTLSDNSK